MKVPSTNGGAAKLQSDLRNSAPDVSLTKAVAGFDIGEECYLVYPLDQVDENSITDVSLAPLGRVVGKFDAGHPGHRQAARDAAVAANQCRIRFRQRRCRGKQCFDLCAFRSTVYLALSEPCSFAGSS
jgi:hypothetical protein